MLTCLKTLAKGNILSEKQQEALIQSIRIRLGKSDFCHDGPVKLTRSQIPAARALLAKHTIAVKKGSSDAAMEQDLVAQVATLTAKVANLERTLDEMLNVSDGKSAPILLNSQSVPAETGLKAADAAVLMDLTKRNEAKRNHESDMICPSGGFAVMNSRPLPPANDMASSTPEIMNDDHEQRTWTPRAEQVCVSYFRNDPRKPPSANLEIGGERYSLIFSSADVAEEKIKGSFSEEWMSVFEEVAGGELRKESRAHAKSDRRYVMSPLYGEKDRFGMKQPVVSDSVAVLQWDPDGRPQSVIIVFGDVDLQVPLRSAPKTKPNGPTHKGSVRLAA